MLACVCLSKINFITVFDKQEEQGNECSLILVHYKMCQFAGGGLQMFRQTNSLVVKVKRIYTLFFLCHGNLQIIRTRCQSKFQFVFATQPWRSTINIKASCSLRKILLIPMYIIDKPILDCWKKDLWIYPSDSILMLFHPVQYYSLHNRCRCELVLWGSQQDKKIIVVKMLRLENIRQRGKFLTGKDKEATSQSFRLNVGRSLQRTDGTFHIENQIAQSQVPRQPSV